MESDFDHIEVGEGVDAAGMTVISANQSGQGDYLVTGLKAGSQHSYALRSVDHAGNRSDWSAIASVTVASRSRRMSQADSKGFGRQPDGVEG